MTISSNATEKSKPSCEVKEKLEEVQASQSKVVNLFAEVRAAISNQLRKRELRSYER